MATAHTTRLIKRYGNRKMYDTQGSRYVTLDNIAELVRGGEDVRIMDNDNGEDLTAVTFAQIIFEEAKRHDGFLGLPVLRSIIQQGNATLHEILHGVDLGREAIENVRELAEKRVKQLAETAGAQARGTRQQISHAEQSGRRLLTELLELPQKRIEQLQQRIDAQVRMSLERITEHPAVKQELRRIERSIKAIERQVAGRPASTRPASKRRGRAKPRRVATE